MALWRKARLFRNVIFMNAEFFITEFLNDTTFFTAQKSMMTSFIRHGTQHNAARTWMAMNHTFFLKGFKCSVDRYQAYRRILFSDP